MSVFRSDDGREIDEADVRLLLRYVPGAVFYGNTEPLEVVKQLSTALAPKPAPTCGAVLTINGYERALTCALPLPDKDGFHEGHHAFNAPTGNFGNYVCQRMWPTVLVQQCSKPESDSVHWKGHAPDPSVWQEP